MTKSWERIVGSKQSTAESAKNKSSCCSEKELNYLNFAKNILGETEPKHGKSGSWEYLEALERKCRCIE